MPMATQLAPAEATVELSVMEPALVVTFTSNLLPLYVASTFGGSGFGPISYFSMSFLISLRRQAQSALVLMRVPACIANGSGNFVFFFSSAAIDAH